jgi:protein-S-isoprenylcysteine O-methyltransferase Ste14
MLVAIFPISEIALAVFGRASARTARVEDRGSLRLLWLVIAVSLGIAIALQWVPGFRLPLSSTHRRLLSLVLLSAGLVLRWAAILTLGHLFTVDVAIQSNHSLVQTGLYGLIRHPSYTGLLVSFLGLGVFFGSWPGLLALVVPITFAVFNRIVKEEQALLEAFGAPYAAYCARTKRLVPGLF